MSATDFANFPFAGPVRRLIALIYDSLLMVAIVFICGVIAVIIQYAVSSPVPEGESLPPLPWIPVTLGLWLAIVSYFNYCWKKRGQTLAMKAWRLRLQQPDGTLATTQQRWCRALLAPLSWVSVIGILWALWDKNAGCLHDKLTGTRVVFLPKGVN